MNRRHLLVRMVQGFSLVGLGFFTYPFVRFMVPGFAENLNLKVPLDDLHAGQAKAIAWRGRNLVVIKRSAMTLLGLKDAASNLKDPQSDESVQPEFARNTFRSLKPNIFIAYTNCTHLGCELAWKGRNDKQIGFTCPCHQSEYDHAGRVFRGGAAPFNLEIPAYRFLSRNVVELVGSSD